VFDCDFQDALLIFVSLEMRETQSSLLLNFFKQI